MKKKFNENPSLKPFLTFAPPGHFYSPLPSLTEIENQKDKIWKPGPASSEIPGIDLNLQDQLAILSQFQKFHQEAPFSDHKQEHLRYYYKNNFFPKGDGNTLYCMIRHLQPQRIIEVGSGYSSAVTLDTNRLFFQNTIDFTLIEPYPKRLLNLITGTDLQNAQLLEKNLQDIPLETFQELKENDILFIDSSHVSKINSDVNYLLFHILPALNPGVWIHFHDIFYPFEYPLHWYQEGRAWNEVYLVRSFLQYNQQFQVKFFLHFLGKCHPQQLQLHLPGFGGGVNLWLRKN